MIPISVKIELWRSTYRAVLLFSQETVNLTAAQMFKNEQFQIKILKAVFKLATRAKSVLVRVLCGMPSIAMEVWKRRLGAMNSILIGDTMTKDYVLLAAICD